MKIVLKIFLSVLKFVSFITLILVLGQLPIARGTVGSHYVVLLKKGARGGAEAIRRSKAYATVAGWPVFSSLMPSAHAAHLEHSERTEPRALTERAEPHAFSQEVRELAPKVANLQPAFQNPVVDNVEDPTTNEEHISASDRESLMRLLK
jgi:hypothetical protein